MITIELAYAANQDVELLPLSVRQGTTVREAILQSEVFSRYPEIDPQTVKVGIYSKLCSYDKVLEQGDRIEIYRLLRADPKEARRKRALRQKRTPR